MSQDDPVTDTGAVDVDGAGAGRDASDAPFQIGDRVVWLGKYRGEVAYVGTTQFAPNLWIGVVLDRPGMYMCISALRLRLMTPSPATHPFVLSCDMTGVMTGSG